MSGCVGELECRLEILRCDGVNGIAFDDQLKGWKRRELVAKERRMHVLSTSWLSFCIGI